MPCITLNYFPPCTFTGREDFLRVGVLSARAVALNTGGVGFRCGWCRVITLSAGVLRLTAIVYCAIILNTNMTIIKSTAKLNCTYFANCNFLYLHCSYYSKNETQIVN